MKARQRFYRAPEAVRFWAKVKIADNGCWEWQAQINQDGYGMFARGHQRGLVSAHRWAYGNTVGPVPQGLELDHLCRNRRCVNPLHLEPVTKADNQRRGLSPWGINSRKTHCKRGHPLSGDNLIVHRDGGRQCYECKAEEQRRRRAKQAAAQRAAK